MMDQFILLRFVKAVKDGKTKKEIEALFASDVPTSKEIKSYYDKAVRYVKDERNASPELAFKLHQERYHELEQIAEEGKASKLQLEIMKRRKKLLKIDGGKFVVASGGGKNIVLDTDKQQAVYDINKLTPAEKKEYEKLIKKASK